MILKVFLVTTMMLSPFVPDCNNTAMQTNVNQKENFEDNKKFIIGRWDGTSEGENMQISLIFHQNGTVVVKENGKTKNLSYKFIGENIIQIDTFSENFILDKISENEIAFRPEQEKLRVDLEIIYEITYKRVTEP